MGLLVVCVALFLAIFVFAGILLAYIAVVDWKTRLISLRALALLVGLRISLAVLSLVVASCVTAPQEQSFDWLFILVDQLSFASLVFSSVGSLSVMVVLMALSALVEVFLRKSKQRQRAQKKQHALLFGREGTLQTLRSSRRHSKGVAKGAYSFAGQDSSEALGRGDVKLIGASCLFLSLGQLPIFLVIVTLSSLVVMTYFLLRFRDKTFPFAPCIVLATLVAFMF